MAIIQGNFGQGSRKKSTISQTKKEPAPFYQLHVSLPFSDPLVWRRVLVSGEMNLFQFHRVLQICMGWSGEYSHQFYVGKVFYEMSSPTGEERKYDEKKFTLHALDEPMRWCFTYLYDAAEGWEFDIILEETTPYKSGKDHPVLLEGELASPPEDIGGVHRYGELLHALQNLSDEKNKRLVKSYDLFDFDPYYFDHLGINETLKIKGGI